MSFQHFRLEATFGPPLAGPTIMMQPSNMSPLASSSISQANIDPNLRPTEFQVQLEKDPGSLSSSKAPYGSGDADDGYTLVFESMETFQVWRRKEEEDKVVEFVKGDTHGSKAVPPRFKDHTKLVCARHQRSGRKKYVKKHPERVRKVPSRKIDGVGCPASISFKTYYDTDEVRVCYMSQHSHETGLANLPFTRRGRKAQVEWEKERKVRGETVHIGADGATHESASGMSPSPSDPASANDNHMSTPSASQAIYPPQNRSAIQSAPPAHLHTPFANAVSMIAPLPQLSAPSPTVQASTHERWERMSTLFNTVRDHAKTFEYPDASVTALESVLIRLYLESPIHGVVPMGSGATISGRSMNDGGGGEAMQEDGD